MSIFGGNLIAKSSFHLHSRLVLLPWLKRSCSVRCSKDREYGSMPVRYIPKKLRETGKPETSSASETKTPSRRLKSRGVEKPNNLTWADRLDYDKFDGSVSSSFRHEHAHGSGSSSFKPDVNEGIGYDIGSMDSQFMEEIDEVDEELGVHNVSSQVEQRLEESKTKKDAGKVAVELLAARAYTAMELGKKLQAKRFPPNIIDGVLGDLQERGILNDSLYAEAYSRSRWTSSCWGPRRIKQALFRKGVNPADAENALKEVFEGEEDGDQDSKLGISNASLDQLYAQATKQWLRSQDAPRDKRKARIVRWLQYRGFHWGIVSIILKKLESQHPP